MANGNLVSKTADAWLRMADQLGAANSEVQELAALHQRALDSRKSYGNVDKPKLLKMNQILEVMPKLHYKGNRPRSKEHSSFLGVLYEFWKHTIRDVEVLIKRSKRQPLELSFSRELEKEINENKKLKAATIDSMKDVSAVDVIHHS